MDIFEKLSRWIDETPPLDNNSRFGNKAYRDWLGKVDAASLDLMLSFLPEELADAASELSGYFMISFGDKTRLDYGTGHETNFGAWLCCLDRLGLFAEDDYYYVVVKVLYCVIFNGRCLIRI